VPLGTRCFLPTSGRIGKTAPAFFLCTTTAPDVGDGEHAEIVIAERVYRVRTSELG
jgi:hypothetical protein